ncbi:hypothetical protein PQR71_40110 [Paraburkholderia fungorum]|uniref:hypothetical protein n=1 Tax=Paraburkholderia fungorum TaxID=134537 RepID=UPI0038BC2007
MAIASFAPTAAVEMPVTATSSQVALPTTGTPTIALLTNLGIQPVFVSLGTSSAVAAVAGACAVVMPGKSLALTIGTNTNLAAVTLTGASGLNVAVGS